MRILNQQPNGWTGASRDTRGGDEKMQGTPKQIKYANEVRNAVIVKCNRTIAEATKYLSEPGGNARALEAARSLAANTIIQALDKCDDAFVILDAFSTTSFFDSPIDNGKWLYEALVAAGHHTEALEIDSDAAELIEDQENGAVADGLYPVYALVNGSV